MDGLERSYRRLLRAFPPDYRRYRGEEMLATLLDRASDGRHRPDLGEAVGLIAAGLRCRFRLRRGSATAIAAVLAALAGAILTGMAGAWLAWTSAAPPLPDQRQAAAIARLAVPQDPSSQERHDFVFGEEDFDYSAGSVRFTYPGTPGAASADLVAQAHERLSADGWSVSVLESAPYRRFVGHRGQVQIVVAEHTAGQTMVRLSRAEPVIVPVLTAGGLLLGGLFGWWLAASVSRRVAHRSAGIRTAVTGLSIVAFTALFPVCFYAFPPVIRGYLRDGQPQAPWGSLTLPGLPELTVLGLLVALALVVGVLATPPRSGAGRTTGQQSA